MKNTTGKLVALFDLDGTLVNTDSINTRAYLRAMDRTGVALPIDMRGSRLTLKKVRRSMAKCTDEQAERISKAKAEEYVKLLWESELGPAAEALRMVLACREKFGKVVLLSDGKPARVLQTLRHHGLDRCFDEIVCNGGEGDKYMNYFRSHNTNPAMTIVWENDPTAIASAISSGVKSTNIKKVG